MNEFLGKVAGSAKALVGAVGLVVTLVQAAVADQAISLDEAEGIATAVLAAVTVVSVWFVPNKKAAQKP